MGTAEAVHVSKAEQGMNPLLLMSRQMDVQLSPGKPGSITPSGNLGRQTPLL